MSAFGACLRCGCAINECECENPCLVQQQIVEDTLVICDACGRTLEDRERYVVADMEHIVINDDETEREFRECRFCAATIN